MIDEQIINMINQSIENLRVETMEGFKEINKKLDNMVNKDQCQEYRNNCNKKAEWSVKKMALICSAITGIFTATGTLLLIISEILDKII